MIDLSEAIVPSLPAIELDELCEYEFCRRSDERWFNLKLIEPMSQEDFQKHGWWIQYCEIAGKDGDPISTEYIHTESLPESLLAVLELHRIHLCKERNAQAARNPLEALLQPLIDAGIAHELPDGALPDGVGGVVLRKPEPDLPPSRNQDKWRRQGWKLIDQNSGMEVPFGEVLRDDDGDEYELLGGYPPQMPGSTGRVFVSSPEDIEQEFFPSIFDLEWRGASREA